MKITVAAAGCGSPALYTDEFRKAVREADMVFTAVRDDRGLKALNPEAGYMSVTDTLSYIEEHAEEDVSLCICASGDTGFYSIARIIKNRAPERTEVRFLPGIGSLSCFCARLGLGYENMKLVSLHGSEKSIVPYVCYNEYVFTLTGGKLKVSDIAGQLVSAGFGDEVTVYAGENLSLEGERIVKGTPSEIAETEFSDLAVAVIHNLNYVNRNKTLRDSDFIRDKVPMTKESVRTLAVSELEIEPWDVVWDVGAGTGSVTCALAYKACENTVYAAERNPEACELIGKNTAHTGARNIAVARGNASDIIKDFPAPHKVFIGGTGGETESIFDTILDKNPDAVICATAVTMESLHALSSAFEGRSMEYTVRCVNVSTADKLGPYHLMRAENPVYILKGKKVG